MDYGLFTKLSRIIALCNFLLSSPYSKEECVCACVCVRACVCACVFTSIRRKGLICLVQLECQGIDQRCCYVVFIYAKSLHRYFRINHGVFLTSHFFLFTNQQHAKPGFIWFASRFQILRPCFTYHYRPRPFSALHFKPIYLRRQTFTIRIAI